MQRLFTQAEIGIYLDIVRDFIVAEFGEDFCSDFEHWQRNFALGNHLRQVYGEFPHPDSSELPIVLGQASCLLIPHSEVEAMRAGQRRDTELQAWQPGEKAVAWIGSIVSDVPGVAAKCIAALVSQVEAMPVYREIDKVAVFCTGPQGYLMSEAFGLLADGASYQDGWPFMERNIEPGELSEISQALQEIWTMTKAKDVVKSARSLWGHDWRRHVLAAREYARGTR